ncbi:MAG: hypothetical protein D6761_05845 [Candidatus Dadabacteria bacterium]|nr:MAG: hypothetical protein D6761_05845 [Candidatus Dadabacteria bacterium]
MPWADERPFLISNVYATEVRKHSHALRKHINARATGYGIQAVPDCGALDIVMSPTAQSLGWFTFAKLMN